MARTRYYEGERWTYKGHVCRIDLDYEEDNIKAFHYVRKPGEVFWTFADITPYDRSMTTVNRWIDAGYPTRIGCGPLYRDDIMKMIS